MYSLPACMYVCTYVCMCACMDACVCTHIYIYIHTYTPRVSLNMVISQLFRNLGILARTMSLAVFSFLPIFLRIQEMCHVRKWKEVGEGGATVYKLMHICMYVYVYMCTCIMYMHICAYQVCVHMYAHRSAQEVKMLGKNGHMYIHISYLCSLCKYVCIFILLFASICMHVRM